MLIAALTFPTRFSINLMWEPRRKRVGGRLWGYKGTAHTTVWGWVADGPVIHAPYAHTASLTSAHLTLPLGTKCQLYTHTVRPRQDGEKSLAAQQPVWTDPQSHGLRNDVLVPLKVSPYVHIFFSLTWTWTCGNFYFSAYVLWRTLAFNSEKSVLLIFLVTRVCLQNLCCAYYIA